MYTQFFGLREKPFALAPNPAYLFLSAGHANALAYLDYGLKEKIGFVMLTGEIGTGKTTLIRYLLNNMEPETDAAVIFNTNTAVDDLIKMILSEFEITYDDTISRAKAMEKLYEFLIDRYAKGIKVLLIIDEAQNLSEEGLEEIRMLSNLQSDKEMLLQIMIIGQPELKEKISDPRLEQFAQRIAVSFHLTAMTLGETGQYIAQRITKAGGRPDIFSVEAVKLIFKASSGIPRTINILCDAAFVFAYADGKKEIDSKVIEQVIMEKGGIGAFHKAGMKKPPPRIQSGRKNSEENPANALESSRQEISKHDLIQKLSSMEARFDQMKKMHQDSFQRLESQSDVKKDQAISRLRAALTREREKNRKLLFAYGRLQERYNLLVKKLRSMT